MLWLKAFHVVSVISWFAALLYLPRLFVYHSQIQGSQIQGSQIPGGPAIDDPVGNARSEGGGPVHRVPISSRPSLCSIQTHRVAAHIGSNGHLMALGPRVIAR